MSRADDRRGWTTGRHADLGRGKQKWAGCCYTLLVLASLSVLGRGSRVRVLAQVQAHWGEACFDCGVPGRPGD